MNRLKALRPESLPIIGSVFACCFWFIDSAIDTFVFEKQRLYVENLLSPDIVELWTRCQVIFLLMLFSLLAMYLLRRQVRITVQLRNYKTHLEQLVDERTNDLVENNHQLKNEIRERRKIEAELAHLATIDHLTGIPNRRKFSDVLNYELMRDERYHNGLSLILCDLDHFKRINDGYGHNVGDETLKQFARLVSGKIRNADIMARWGGEEFVLLLPETKMETAMQIAEKLRQEIEQFHFPAIGNITASFGVTQYLAGDNDTSLIMRADEALYRSKENGRNKVEILPPLHTLQSLYPGMKPKAQKQQTSRTGNEHNENSAMLLEQG